MELSEDPCFLIVPEEGIHPGCGARCLNIRYCEAKRKYCLTGCEYCRNDCPCEMQKRTRTL